MDRSAHTHTHRSCPGGGGEGSARARDDQRDPTLVSTKPSTRAPEESSTTHARERGGGGGGGGCGGRGTRRQITRSRAIGSFIFILANGHTCTQTVWIYFCMPAGGDGSDTYRLRPAPHSLSALGSSQRAVTLQATAVGEEKERALSRALAMNLTPNWPPVSSNAERLL